VEGSLKYFKLEKPDISRVNVVKVLTLATEDSVKSALKKTHAPKYLYWDKVKHHVSSSLTSTELWYVIKFIRMQQRIQAPISSESNKNFTWTKLIDLEEILHKIDLNTGGALAGEYTQYDEKENRKFISRGILEEAIASSQLEGANTTRKYAKQMIQEGISPRTKSEHMIVNTHQAMQRVEEVYKAETLSMELLYEMHELITKNTLPNEDIGRLRSDEDEIVILKDHHTVAFKPPSEAFLKQEIKNLIKFANNEIKHDFLHPLIKAVMLHFWFAYLHPFVDGNGRVARLLFYWYMIKNGYWAFAYLPISTVIKKNRKGYEMAFIYAEQDDYDLTYFLDYILEQIKVALEEFQKYVGQVTEKLKMERQFDKYKLNPRQSGLMRHYLENSDTRTTIVAHSHINKISRRTAEMDLHSLVGSGLIRSEKRGRQIYYYPVNDLEIKI